jgi:hypothetical protein
VTAALGIGGAGGEAEGDTFQGIENQELTRHARIKLITDGLKGA